VSVDAKVSDSLCAVKHNATDLGQVIQTPRQSNWRTGALTQAMSAMWPCPGKFRDRVGLSAGCS